MLDRLTDWTEDTRAVLVDLGYEGENAAGTKGRVCAFRAV